MNKIPQIAPSPANCFNHRRRCVSAKNGIYTASIQIDRLRIRTNPRLGLAVGSRGEFRQLNQHGQPKGVYPSLHKG